MSNDTFNAYNTELHPWKYSRSRSLHPLFWGRFEYTNRFENIGLNPKVGLPQTLLIIRIPYWIPTLAAATIMGMLVFRHHRQKRTESRVRSGLCTNCGYDLRAGHRRCPECGTVCAIKAH